MNMEASTSASADSVGEENALLIAMPFVVLREVLSYLPARDLGEAALVCHEWNDVCRIIRRGRQIIHWFEWHSPKVGRKWTLQSPRAQINEEFGRIFSEPILCLFFSSKKINAIKAYGGLHEDPPSTANICFCDYTGEGSPCNHAPAIRHLMSMMPRNCSTIGVTAYGTIGTPRELNPIIELNEKASLSMLMIPEIPGVITRPFVVEMKFYMNLISDKLHQEILTDEELRTMTGIPPNEDVKCLLLFCDSVDGEHAAQYIVNTLNERSGYKLAVGGGIGEDCSISRQTQNPLLMGVAISGESVRAVSTVIPETVVGLFEIEEYIKKLKSCKVPSENCLGFMFTCMCRRIQKNAGVKKTESSLFRTHFPSVPLVGFMASGEMGVDHLVPCGDTQDGNSVTSEDVEAVKEPRSKKHRKKSYVDIAHEYSTVFVVVSLKKGKRLDDGCSNLNDDQT